MRGLPRIVGLFAVGLAWASSPAVGSAGWITLASGTHGNAFPIDTAELRYGSAPAPLVSIDTVSGTGIVQAVTGGGTAFVSGLGTPVLFDLSDGTAYLTGGSPPGGAVEGSLGAGADPLASATPRAGTSAPPDSARIGIALSASGTGAQVLTVSVLGAAPASSSVVVPEGGWWVLGLGTGREPAPEPEVPGGTPEPNPGPAPGVPEPATMALAASGAFVVVPWLRRRRRIERR